MGTLRRAHPTDLIPLRYLAVVLFMLLGTPAVQAAPFAYITNSSSNNVSVIDTATNTVVATVAVGTNPSAFGLFIGPAAAPASIGPVPTLSQWALLTLAGLVGLWGVAQVRRTG